MDHTIVSSIQLPNVIICQMNLKQNRMCDAENATIWWSQVGYYNSNKRTTFLFKGLLKLVAIIRFESTGVEYYKKTS